MHVRALVRSGMPFGDTSKENRRGRRGWWKRDRASRNLCLSRRIGASGRRGRANEDNSRGIRFFSPLRQDWNATRRDYRYLPLACPIKWYACWTCTRYAYRRPRDICTKIRSVPSIGSDRLVFAGQLFRHGGEGRAAWKRASNGTSNASTSAKTLVHLRRSFVRRPRLNNAAAGKWILMAASTPAGQKIDIDARGWQNVLLLLLSNISSCF